MNSRCWGSPTGSHYRKVSPANMSERGTGIDVRNDLRSPRLLLSFSEGVADMADVSVECGGKDGVWGRGNRIG